MRLPQTHKGTVRFLLAALVAVIFVAGCASNKPQINISEEQNFTKIDTFYIQPPLNPVNPTIENHMMTSISSALQSKGLTPASKENADVEVGFFPSTALKEDGSSVSFGVGTGVFGRSSGISLGSVFSVPVGEQVTQYQNLQIDIVKDGAFVYSAAGSAELDAKDSISIQRAMTGLVQELLQSYPQKAPAPAESQ